MELKVMTNRAPRDLISWNDLSDKERKDFDYIDAEYRNDCNFFRYRGHVYDIGEFVIPPLDLKGMGWEGYVSDTYFSGVVIKLVECATRVIVGTFYS